MNRNRVLFGFIRAGVSVIVILIVIYFAVGLSKTAYNFGYRVFTETAIDSAPGTDVLVQIKEGMSEKDMAALLQERGLVRDANLFYIQLKLSVYSGKMMPGVYTLNTSMKPKELMAVIAPEVEESTENTETQSTVVESTQDTVEESTEGTMADTEQEANE